MSFERKGFALKSINRPLKRVDLLSTVAVFKGGKAYHCYVSFSDKMVEFVGKKLPHGVSVSNPAYLMVQVEDDGRCEVRVRSVQESTHEKILWVSPTTPEWLKFHKSR